MFEVDGEFEGALDTVGPADIVGNPVGGVLGSPVGPREGNGEGLLEIVGITDTVGLSVGLFVAGLKVAAFTVGLVVVVWPGAPGAGVGVIVCCA